MSMFSVPLLGWYHCSCKSGWTVGKDYSECFCPLTSLFFVFLPAPKWTQIPFLPHKRAVQVKAFAMWAVSEVKGASGWARLDSFSCRKPRVPQVGSRQMSLLAHGKKLGIKQSQVLPPGLFFLVHAAVTLPGAFVLSSGTVFCFICLYYGRKTGWCYCSWMCNV